MPVRFMDTLQAADHPDKIVMGRSSGHSVLLSCGLSVESDAWSDTSPSHLFAFPSPRPTLAYMNFHRRRNLAVDDFLHGRFHMRLEPHRRSLRLRKGAFG